MWCSPQGLQGGASYCCCQWRWCRDGWHCSWQRARRKNGARTGKSVRSWRAVIHLLKCTNVQSTIRSWHILIILMATQKIPKLCRIPSHPIHCKFPLLLSITLYLYSPSTQSLYSTGISSCNTGQNNTRSGLLTHGRRRSTLPHLLNAVLLLPHKRYQITHTVLNAGVPFPQHQQLLHLLLALFLPSLLLSWSLPLRQGFTTDITYQGTCQFVLTHPREYR